MMSFQSTFPRGERLKQIAIDTILMNFNPRSHVGNDKQITDGDTTENDFNPRSHVGNDFCLILIQLCDHRFQSTFPRGERQLRIDGLTPKLKFQSTFPRGERQLFGYAAMIESSFQSTFSRGERLPYGRCFRHLQKFQSTFPRGERRIWILQ